jgi:hypothetical protein
MDSLFVRQDGPCFLQAVLFIHPPNIYSFSLDHFHGKEGALHFMAWSKEDWYEIDEVLQDIAHLLGKIEREESKKGK